VNENAASTLGAVLGCDPQPSPTRRRRWHYAPGLVEKTVPGQAPEQIAVLRLDTDWYASTKHELQTLYPPHVRWRAAHRRLRLVAGLAQGRRRVPRRDGHPLLLLRMAEGRIAVKP
jgi:hypothetical protein